MANSEKNQEQKSTMDDGSTLYGVTIGLAALSLESIAALEVRLLGVIHRSLFAIESVMTDNGLKTFLFFCVRVRNGTSLCRSLDKELAFIALFEGMHVGKVEVQAAGESPAREIGNIDALRLVTFIELAILQSSPLAPKEHLDLITLLSQKITEYKKIHDFENLHAAFRLCLAFALPPSKGVLVVRDMFTGDANTASINLGESREDLLDTDSYAQRKVSDKPGKLELMLGLPPQCINQYRAVNLNQVVVKGCRLHWKNNGITRFAGQLNYARREKDYVYILLQVDSDFDPNVLVQMCVKSGFLSTSLFLEEGYKTKLDFKNPKAIFSLWARTRQGIMQLGQDRFLSGVEAANYGGVIKDSGV